MAWDHLDITKPHLVYIILGGFTSLFMLCSSFIKERMYIGEATVATLCGVIFGPHAANLINPNEWGSVDIVTVEFSRIVLVVQCFAVGVELPKFYMERHWKSVVFLLVPVMMAGWLLTSLFVWWLIPPLSWLESLVVAACVTATDPVLASSVVGKGKFAKRVPKHLRDLLSAESGCNDGMAFPFIYLSLYLIQYNRDASEVTFHFIVYVILYECIFGAIYGFTIGYIARHGIRFAESRDLVDRESFLVFYFVVALFCAGSGSILGMDDLLVGFAAGVGFSNDGWFTGKTEESSVSNVIDLLLNLAYFVYFGTIIPWEQYNSGIEGLTVWRLVVVAIFVLLFRRIPIMMALKPFIPDIRNWREALFAGHFGPIGVGAIFVAILARAELEHEEPVPLAALPGPEVEHYTLLYLVWPIVTFLVISSILVHGSSIAVFTLGKRINTLTLTMSYTMANEDGPTWMNRLPRISSTSRSQAKTMSEASFDLKEPQFPGSTLAPPSGFLRRQRDDESSRPTSRASSLVRKRKHKKWDAGIGPGGPVSQSAIFPNRTFPIEAHRGSTLSEKEQDAASSGQDDTTAVDDSPKTTQQTDDGDDHTRRIQVYEEGSHLVFEDEDGEVIDTAELDDDDDGNVSPGNEEPESVARRIAKTQVERGDWSFGGLKRRMAEVYTSEMDKRKNKDTTQRNKPARAYQFGNQIIVEDEDGEVVKTYELPSSKEEQQGSVLESSLKYLGLGALARQEKAPEAVAEEGEVGTEQDPSSFKFVRRFTGAEGNRRKSVAATDDDPDDKNIRFTIGGKGGKRMNKEDFLKEVQKLDASGATAEEASKAATGRPRRGTQPALAVPRIVETRAESDTRRANSASPRRGRPVEKPQPKPQPKAQPKPTNDFEETPVERKRRLAALASQADDDSGDSSRKGKSSAAVAETPAERRRREAALSMGAAAASDSDSDDDGGERVPPTRRGIRFAEPSKR